MAHTLLAVRGFNEDVEIFIKELSTRYLTREIYNPKTKKMEKKHQQMRVCPVQIFDISYPKEHQDAVLNTILAGADGSANPSKMLNKLLWPLRKILKLNPIPKYSKKSVLVMRAPQNMELIGIGCKDDYWIEPDGRHVAEKDKSPLATEGI